MNKQIRIEKLKDEIQERHSNLEKAEKRELSALEEHKKTINQSRIEVQKLINVASENGNSGNNSVNDSFRHVLAKSASRSGLLSILVNNTNDRFPSGKYTVGKNYT